MTAIGWKTIGAILTVGSGAFCGAIAIQRERTRLSVLDAWINVIERIRTQIDLYLRPLDEIVAQISPTLLLHAGAGAQRSTLGGAFLAASPYLSDEAKRLIGGLLAELGTTYRQEQVRLCDERLSALRGERERLRETLPARMRLCGTLGPCIAAGVAILLW